MEDICADCPWRCCCCIVVEDGVVGSSGVRVIVVVVVFVFFAAGVFGISVVLYKLITSRSSIFSRIWFTKN